VYKYKRRFESNFDYKKSKQEISNGQHNLLNGIDVFARNGQNNLINVLLSLNKLYSY